MSDRSAAVMTASTTLGWMAAVGRSDVVGRLVMGHRSEYAALRAIAKDFPEGLENGCWHDDLLKRLQAYAEGDAVDFSDVELDLSHLTSFARRVVQACRDIPHGETMTYGQLAARAGSPSAARAVGSVMSSNRFPIIVPCHRVVAAGGGLGGFSAPQGIRLKKKMLDLEAQAAALTFSGA